MSNQTPTLSTVQEERAFGLGLLLGQIAVHCEHVTAGGKLAAQIGCDQENIGVACEAISKAGCHLIVDDSSKSERASVWIFKKAIAATLIRALEREPAPSPSGAVISGKLFGYSDHEIEEYVTGQFPSEQFRATSESEPNSLRDSGTGGSRMARVCCSG
jgi:hypothetical protein